MVRGIARNLRLQVVFVKDGDVQFEQSRNGRKRPTDFGKDSLPLQPLQGPTDRGVHECVRF